MANMANMKSPSQTKSKTLLSTVRFGLPFALVAGCLSNDAPTTPSDDGGTWEGIEEGAQGLVNPLGTAGANCSLNTTTKTLTYTFNDAVATVILVSKNVSNLITFNNFTCPGITATNFNKLVINGGAGNETVIIDYLPSGVFLPGLAAVGTTPASPGIVIDLKGGTNAVKVRGTALADTMTLGTLGFSIKTATLRDVSFIATGGTVSFTAALSAGNDVFSGNGSTATGAAYASPILVFGGDGNDTLRGGAGNDILNGGNDNDTFNAGTAADGADTFNGGTGNTFSGTGSAPAEADVVDYSARTNAVQAVNDGQPRSGEFITAALGDEHDTIGTDIEIIKGGPGNDVLGAGPNATTIFGNDGNDTISGGAGIDTLNGGNGNDTFSMGSASGSADVIIGGAGIDTVDFSARTHACAINLDGTATSGETGELATIGTDVENATGGSAGNTMNGNASDNVLIGGAGVDVIHGLDGNDTLVGLAGDDTLNGGNGNDTFDESTLTEAHGTTAATFGPNGADHIFGSAGSDTVDYSKRLNAVQINLGNLDSGGVPIPSGENVTAVLGDEGDIIENTVENANGGPGDDLITGSPVSNQIEGNGGADTIHGLGGGDLIDGGPGNDIIDCGGGDGVNLDNGPDVGLLLTPPVPNYTNCD